MNDFDDDAVRTFINENLTYDDIREDRYDELLRRSLQVPIIKALDDAFDEVYGVGAASGYTKLDELHVIVSAMLQALTSHDVYLMIRRRIKSREGL